MLTRTPCVLNRALYENGSYLCQICSQPSVTESDGFLMSRCMNCESRLSVTQPVTCRLDDIIKKVTLWCKKIKKSLSRGAQ